MCLSPLWGQDFLFNQSQSRGQWVLDQKGDTITFNKSEGISTCMNLFNCEILSFYRKDKDFYFGNIFEHDQAQYTPKRKNKFTVNFTGSSTLYTFLYKPKENTFTYLETGDVYISKNMKDYFYEKMAGTYLNGTDTVRFYSDGHSENFYLDRNYYAIHQGDSFGLGEDIIYFNSDKACLEAKPDCNLNCYATLFAFLYTKKQIEFYDLIQTTCTDCKPDYSKGQLLYTLKRID